MIIYGKRISDGEVTVIDTNKSNWDEIHVWLSGQRLGRFAGLPVEEPQTADDSDFELLELQLAYANKFGKKLAPAYKNNKERIRSKLSE